jgi:glycosyltransferase involved in cell wall biosynthesis
MKETDFSFSHIDTPDSGVELSRGRHIVRGWVMPKNGGHFVDVRARIGDRIFAGVHGLPRVDLAVHFKTGLPVALAEFYIVIEIDSGPCEVVLETLEIEGRWSEFHGLNFAVDLSAPVVDVATPSGPLRWHEYGRALQILLRAQRTQPNFRLEDLAEKIVSDIPYPRDLRHPHLPFHGHLDEPAAITRCGFGRTAVLGYLFHEDQPITRVLATFDLQAWQTIQHNMPSPGPAEYYPKQGAAKYCGLFGIIDVPAQLPNPVCLRLYAELADGSLNLCSVQRSQLFTNEDEKAPYPAQITGSFTATQAALDQALLQREIDVVSDKEFSRELKRIQADFLFCAPQTVTPVPPLLPAPISRTAPMPKRVLMVSHNLNLEGAPLFLIDLAQHYVSLGVKLTLLSPSDGPLRARFAAVGASIQLVEIGEILAATDKSEFESALSALTKQCDFSAYDLVICNTFTTFWAVHAAKAAHRQVLLYVHESTTPASFYLGRMHPEVVAQVNTAFRLADCVSFTTSSTRYYHTDYGLPANHRHTPGWIDVGRIDKWREHNTRNDLRAKFDLNPDELLVTNVGTVCDRKGQHIFVRAVDLLWRRYPDLAARSRFVMLGGGKTPFDVVLTDLLHQLKRPNITVHSATVDYFPYYAAADLVVCSTYEESSPRVILETMAFLTPLLSSNVHGVPEQARPDLEASLVPPGDTVALCEAMAKLLISPKIGYALAQRARARVVAEFEAGILLPRHAALACEVAAGQI